MVTVRNGVEISHKLNEEHKRVTMDTLSLNGPYLLYLCVTKLPSCYTCVSVSLNGPYLLYLCICITKWPSCYTYVSVSLNDHSCYTCVSVSLNDPSSIPVYVTKWPCLVYLCICITN
jgi:hypothetical protein